MSPPRIAAAALLLAGLVAGSIGDPPAAHTPLRRGDEIVITADFHVHAFLGDGTFWPWDLVLEGRRQGLDAFAITNHNQTVVARIGRWASQRLGGPIVLVGEEITAPRYHLIGVGLKDTVSARQPAALAIRAVHAQGGVAIAAHPNAAYWAGFEDEALKELDGAEVCHPGAYAKAGAMEEFRRFYEHAESLGHHITPIGSSDFHGPLGAPGLCRTFLFLRENSEAGILAALRSGRSVVYAADGTAYGDPELVAWLSSPAGLAARNPPPRDGRAAVSALPGFLGLAGLLLLGPSRTRPT